LALLNGLLGVFNLLPAFPLDGGRVLRAALWKFKGKMKATRIASGVGTLFAYLLIFRGVYWLISGEPLDGIWFILIGWFLKDASAGAYQQVRLSEMLSGVLVRDLMVPKCVAIPAHISIGEAVQSYFLRYGYGGFPVEDRGQIRGLLSLSDVKRIPRQEWSNTSVQAHMAPVGEKTTIAADKDITEALRQMAQSGTSRLVVVDPLQKCIGMITHNGILTRLRAQEALNG
jgi:CBS domain-containing protein